MLSRLADSLYWIGRYVERVEHLSRYLKVQYFTILDAPMSQQKDFVLRSIANMAGIPLPEINQVDEEQILYDIALNPDNTQSILYCVFQARENARGVRNVISKELWESINKLYRHLKDYPIDDYKKTGLYDFTVTTLQHIAMFRSVLDGTLLHDETWNFIRLGLHLERSSQITRILQNKLIDTNALMLAGKNVPLENYQWITTLKVLEALDMSRKVYKKTPNQKTTCEFLITHPEFPRSIAYNLRFVHDFIERIETDKINSNNKKSLSYVSEKLAAQYKFLEYDSIKDDLDNFLQKTLNELTKLNDLIAKRYTYI